MSYFAKRITVGIVLCFGITFGLGAKTTKIIHEDIDIAYGEHDRQKLDVVWVAENAPSPVVIFFHGGSWRWGVKDFYRDIGKEFAKQGVTFVLANYRLYPDVRFPAFIEDAAMVVKWTRKHIGRYAGNLDEIFLMGHSSGAHIVSHLALEESYLKAVGGDFSWIKGVIGMSCPYTFQPSDEWLYNDIFQPLAKSPKVVPISLVDGDEPPFLVLHGRYDYLVNVKQADAFTRRIEEKGGKVTKRIFLLHGHFSMMRRITSWYVPPKGILHEVLDFVKKKS